MRFGLVVVWWVMLAWGLLSSDARAQLAELLSRSVPPGMEASPQELDAFWALVDSRHVRARELAEKLLKKHPDSYVGQYVLGQVEHDAEANFPRSVFHFDRALELFEARHGRKPAPDMPWRWHSRILSALSFAEGELERHARKLELLQRYNELYDPDRLAERAWPLMKLRRYAQARAAAQEGFATGDPRQVEVALNAFCAVEFEAGNDERSYAACHKAMEHARSLGAGLDAVDLLNFAEASRSVFKLDEAERIDLEALDHGVVWYGNPWSELSELYVRQGRLAEALSTLKEVPTYRKQRPPHVRESDRNENRRALASFFVVMGRGQDALRITGKALVAPDRRGHASRDPLQDRAVTALLDRQGHRIAAERLHEAAVGKPLWERIWAHGEALMHRVQGWMSGRRAVRALAEGNRLEGSFRIGTAESAVLPPWLAGDLVSLVGPAVAQQAIARAQKGDKRSQAQAYYHAFQGEAAWLAGDLKGAERALSQALGSLGQSERLLRARVLALLSAVNEDHGAPAAAARDLERTLEVDPGVLRRFGRALSVRIEGARGEVGEAIEDGLERSPRLDVDDGSFRVRIKADRQRAEACLLSARGSVLGCGRGEAKSHDDAQALADRTLQDFHAQVFAPRVDLSQADAHSLDGSTLGRRDDMLDDMMEEGELE